MKAAAQNVLGDWSTGADLTAPMQALADTARTFLQGNLLPMIGNVLAGIPQLVYGLVPEVIQTGTELVSSLAAGFAQGIPAFLSTALPQLLSFTEELRANAGQFVDAGLNCITQLLNGLIAGLPQLIAYVRISSSTSRASSTTICPRSLRRVFHHRAADRGHHTGRACPAGQLAENFTGDPVCDLCHQLAEHRQEHPHQRGERRKEHGLQYADRLQGRLFQRAELDQEPARAGGEVGQKPDTGLYQGPDRQGQCGEQCRHRCHCRYIFGRDRQRQAG